MIYSDRERSPATSGSADHTVFDLTWFDGLDCNERDLSWSG